MNTPTPACDDNWEPFDAMLDHHPDTPAHQAARAVAVKVCAGCPMVACGHRVRTPVCGTTAGYARHRRAGEPACDACRHASRDYNTARRRIA